MKNPREEYEIPEGTKVRIKEGYGGGTGTIIEHAPSSLPIYIVRTRRGRETLMTSQFTVPLWMQKEAKQLGATLDNPASRKLGMNPKKRRKTVTKSILPLAIIGGLMWILRRKT